MDDYEIKDGPCPHCGNPILHFRDCDVCEDGFIDEYEDDPINNDPGDTSICHECHGTGVIRWCPNCGRDVVLDPNGVGSRYELDDEIWDHQLGQLLRPETVQSIKEILTKVNQSVHVVDGNDPGMTTRELIEEMISDEHYRLFEHEYH